MAHSAQMDSDGALALRIAELGGDAGAEAELCRRYARRALLYGLRHLSGAAAAEDLAQEALLTMLLALRDGKLKEPEQLTSFVLGTCRRLAIAQRRRSQRREALIAQAAVQEVVEQLPREVDPARLQDCLGRLAEREQAIVAMTFQRDLSAEVIAETLGLSAGNVRVLRHRTLARLHGCIGGLEAAP